MPRRRTAAGPRAADPLRASGFFAFLLCLQRRAGAAGPTPPPGPVLALVHRYAEGVWDWWERGLAVAEGVAYARSRTAPAVTLWFAAASTGWFHVTVPGVLAGRHIVWSSGRCEPLGHAGLGDPDALAPRPWTAFGGWAVEEAPGGAAAVVRCTGNAVRLQRLGTAVALGRADLTVLAPRGAVSAAALPGAPAPGGTMRP